MRKFTDAPLNPARALLILMWGTLCWLIFGAPLFAAHASHSLLAALIYLFFAPICHQSPDRSFLIAGHALAVCQRCTGIYLGLFLGSLVPFNRHLLASTLRRRNLVVISTLPLLFDAALGYLSIWPSGPLSRFTSGLIFGTMLSLLLVSAVEEILGGVSCKQLRFIVKGGIT